MKALYIAFLLPLFSFSQESYLTAATTAHSRGLAMGASLAKTWVNRTFEGSVGVEAFGIKECHPLVSLFLGAKFRASEANTTPYLSLFAGAGMQPVDGLGASGGAGVGVSIGRLSIGADYRTSFLLNTDIEGWYARLGVNF